MQSVTTITCKHTIQTKFLDFFTSGNSNYSSRAPWRMNVTYIFKVTTCICFHGDTRVIIAISKFTGSWLSYTSTNQHIWHIWNFTKTKPWKHHFKRQGQERFQKSCTNTGKKFFWRISAIHIYNRSMPKGELMWKDTFTLTILFYAR